MSWHPLRDSFDLTPETQAVIRALPQQTDDDHEERETCSRCGADLLDNPSPMASDDLCFDCRYEESDGEEPGRGEHA